MKILRDYLNECASSQEETSDYIGKQYDSNLAQFRNLLGGNSDIIIREFSINAERNIHFAIIYLENMVDKNRINQDILQPLIVNAAELTAKNTKTIVPYLKSQLATVSDIKTETTFSGAIDCILSGDTIVVINGVNEVFIYNTKSWIQRGISSPEIESTIRGPRDSFVETLETNITLLRRRINHPDLMVEPCKVGRMTRTNIAIIYLKGIINDKIIEEIKLRLNRINTDGILGAGYVEQFIGDAPISVFSTVSYSERPDIVSANILEGRAAIIIDGNPEVLTVPTLFIESFQSPDDYNFNPFYATLMRWIRYIGFGLSIFGPAVYIALSSYNQELIPTPLFINMAAGSEGTPYPVFVEVIVIGLLFEIFREAGVRLPRPFGQGISFVMALVLAQASVTMGLAGVATVIVVTLTAIASFVVPKQMNTSVLIRLFLAVLASIFGVYGILLGLLWTIAHMLSLRSFGVPYLSPVAPLNIKEFSQDVLFRAPLWSMLTRSRMISWHNSKRQEQELMPQHNQTENISKHKKQP